MTDDDMLDIIKHIYHFGYLKHFHIGVAFVFKNMEWVAGCGTCGGIASGDSPAMAMEVLLLHPHLEGIQ
jgi:hypothetical protein